MQSPIIIYHAIAYLPLPLLFRSQEFLMRRFYNFLRSGEELSDSQKALDFVAEHLTSTHFLTPPVEKGRSSLCALHNLLLARLLLLDRLLVRAVLAILAALDQHVEGRDQQECQDRRGR